jgi:hypothetical protein
MNTDKNRESTETEHCVRTPYFILFDFSYVFICVYLCSSVVPPKKQRSREKDGCAVRGGMLA